MVPNGSFTSHGRSVGRSVRLTSTSGPNGTPLAISAQRHCSHLAADGARLYGFGTIPRDALCPAGGRSATGSATRCRSFGACPWVRPGPRCSIERLGFQRFAALPHSNELRIGVTGEQSGFEVCFGLRGRLSLRLFGVCFVRNLRPGAAPSRIASLSFIRLTDMVRQAGKTSPLTASLIPVRDRFAHTRSSRRRSHGSAHYPRILRIWPRRYALH